MDGGEYCVAEVAVMVVLSVEVLLTLLPVDGKWYSRLM